ncbi:MAG: toll/interleukin-1 receptor domain-containing protein [Bryobacteraceae bacterium]
MTDLFLSYTSWDRPWAERLYYDLKLKFPTMTVFWDQDRESLPLGEFYRPALIEAVKATTNFVVLWSNKAKASDEVGPEVQAFLQHRSDHPQIDGIERKFFYVPLDASDYGQLKDVQALFAVRTHNIYDPSEGVEDRGVNKLKGELERTLWDRLVRDIGSDVLARMRGQPITLAVVAMNADMATELDAILSRRLIGPTLQEVLDAYALTLADVKKRYHETAFNWQPFGNEQTIIDLMEDMRVAANARLKGQPEFWFRWDPWDLLETVRGVASHQQLRDALDRLATVPFALVVDPITLHHPLLTEVFRNLGPYTMNEQSLFIALAPTRQPAIETVYQYLSSRGAPALDEFFLPSIPRSGPLWGCALNVQHAMDIERLIRGSLGVVYREKLKSEHKPLFSAAG